MASETSIFLEEIAQELIRIGAVRQQGQRYVSTGKPDHQRTGRLNAYVRGLLPQLTQNYHAGHDDVINNHVLKKMVDKVLMAVTSSNTPATEYMPHLRVSRARKPASAVQAKPALEEVYYDEPVSSTQELNDTYQHQPLSIADSLALSNSPESRELPVSAPRKKKNNYLRYAAGLAIIATTFLSCFKKDKTVTQDVQHDTTTITAPVAVQDSVAENTISYHAASAMAAPKDTAQKPSANPETAPPLARKPTPVKDIVAETEDNSLQLVRDTFTVTSLQPVSSLLPVSMDTLQLAASGDDDLADVDMNDDANDAETDVDAVAEKDFVIPALQLPENVGTDDSFTRTADPAQIPAASASGKAATKKQEKTTKPVERPQLPKTDIRSLETRTSKFLSVDTVQAKVKHVPVPKKSVAKKTSHDPNKIDGKEVVSAYKPVEEPGRQYLDIILQPDARKEAVIYPRETHTVSRKNGKSDTTYYMDFGPGVGRIEKPTKESHNRRYSREFDEHQKRFDERIARQHKRDSILNVYEQKRVLAQQKTDSVKNAQSQNKADIQANASNSYWGQQTSTASPGTRFNYQVN